MAYCGDPGYSLDVCVNGACSNITGLWECVCTFPYTNVGDLVTARTNPCVINIYGIQAAWGVCLASWLAVGLFGLKVVLTMREVVPDSWKRNAELTLISTKCLHAALFVIVSCIEINSPSRAVGVDYATSIIYSFASLIFWTEFQLFLVTPTLSNLTAVAQVVAPRPVSSTVFHFDTIFHSVCNYSIILLLSNAFGSRC